LPAAAAERIGEVSTSSVKPAAPRAPWIARLCVWGTWLLLGCGHAAWPDEPGVPVELGASDNVDSADAFLSALTSRRRAASRTTPIVVAQYQAQLRAFAESLQGGAASAAEIEKALREWARSIWGGEVAIYALDCSKGEGMALPSSLVDRSSAGITFAAAHFRPRSLTQNQCAILVVAPSGGAESVEATKL